MVGLFPFWRPSLTDTQVSLTPTLQHYPCVTKPEAGAVDDPRLSVAPIAHVFPPRFVGRFAHHRFRWHDRPVGAGQKIGRRVKIGRRGSSARASAARYKRGCAGDQK
jgi:hypothetical protein